MLLLCDPATHAIVGIFGVFFLVRVFVFYIWKDENMYNTHAYGAEIEAQEACEYTYTFGFG